MMRVVYTIIFSLLLPFIFLKLWWKGRKNPAYREAWRQRLGRAHLSSSFKDNASSPRLWIHAVSVGETEAATALVSRLITEIPDCQILFTNTTPTGAATARLRFADLIEKGQLDQTYIPYDLPCMQRHFLEVNAINAVVIMETEIWPNLLHVCQQRAVPVILANARLAERSQARYAKLSGFTRQVFNQFSAIIAQTPLDADRFKALGVAPSRVHSGGNLKCDHDGGEISLSEVEQWQERLGRTRPTWVAGSTHEGEEEILLAAHRHVIEAEHNALLIMVPRHPERFDSVFKLCESSGFMTERFSEVTGKVAANTQVLVLDKMGLLLHAYAATQVSFVAGTLMPIGGHNILEPARFAKPVIVGIETFKIEHLMQVFVASDAVIIVKDAADLSNSVLDLLQNKTRADALGERAKQILIENQGASQRHIDVIAPLLHS